MVKITLPDGSSKSYKGKVTGMKIAESIGSRLAKDAVAVEVNGSLVDLDAEIKKDAKVRIVTFKDDEGRNVFWHSSSHVLAQAVKELWPKVKLAIGPAIENGFYYDFEKKEPFTPKDLEKIEEKMREIAGKKLKFERKELEKKKVREFFKKKSESYKVELIKDLNDKVVSVYENDAFVDLCAGPHLPSTGHVKHFKLLKVAGAYWRGNEKNKMLQRIYGISFPEKKMLDAFLTRQGEAGKRNHLKLGKELDLFSMHDSAPGVPFIHPKGMVIWNEILDYWREEHKKEGYDLTQTPIIMKKELWVQSGHWDHFKENMYFTKIDDCDYAIKPMNCPGGILIYKTKRHSYRDLPIKMGELGIVHRHEKSGVLQGLLRVRKFTQDDAHIFCLPEQIKEEVEKVIELTLRIYRTFGFKNYKIELSTRPEKSMGPDEMWEKAETLLEEALKEKKIQYKINKGDGAFYGPKIDFHVEDALGRTWQCATIQLDFAMPEKFNVFYIGNDDKEHRPAMIHRVILGSMERFFGILIEHYAGSFPLWLSPMQARVIAIADRHVKYAEKVRKKLAEEGVRVDVDSRSETVSYKVRDAQLQKINYILVVGDREEKGGSVAVRERGGKVLGAKKVDSFLKQMQKEIESKQ